MITTLIVLISILSLFLLFTVVMVSNIDLRAVFDVENNLFVIELKLFNIRIGRIRLFVHNGAFYYKRLRLPYRIIRRSKGVAESGEDSDSKKPKKLDMNALISSFEKDKVYFENVRVYILYGGESPLTTGLIWSGAEILGGIIVNLASKVSVTQEFTLLMKPQFEASELIADLSVRMRISEITKSIFKIIKNRKKVNAID